MSCKQLRDLTCRVSQLAQLTTLTYSGDLISTSTTEEPVKDGLAVGVGIREYYITTDLGVQALERTGYLRV